MFGLAADQGHVNARHDLGQMQRHAGLKRAADRGDADAQYQVGMLYRDGQEVPEDRTEATRRFPCRDAAVVFRRWPDMGRPRRSQAGG